MTSLNLNIKFISTYVPINNSHISTPSDQKSTALSWPLLRIISGATYSGVPQNVHVLLPSFITFENPKSTWKFSNKNVFAIIHTSHRIYKNVSHNSSYKWLHCSSHLSFLLTILTYPEASSKRFSGFKSLYMIPWLCR